MNRNSALLLLLAALLGAGCDTLNHVQYQVPASVSQTGARLTLAEADREFVKTKLAEIAARHRFEDRTQLSLIPDVLCVYAQADTYTPIRLAAWVKEDRIIVDLLQEPDTPGETLQYREVHAAIQTELKQHFGNRVIAPGTMQRTPGAPSRK
jgi:hypothetical protein